MFGKEKINVHAGDFKKGKEHYLDLLENKLMLTPKGSSSRERISVNKIDEIDVASEENIKKIGGAVGWGVAGAALLGPVGLLAGLIAGGKGKNVNFVCKLKDGRKFLATVSSKAYTKLQAALFD